MQTLTRHVFVLACPGLLRGGCNTMQGLGEDLRRAGGVIQDAAQRNDD